jgi:hypothetical protein
MPHTNAAAIAALAARPALSQVFIHSAREIDHEHFYAAIVKTGFLLPRGPIRATSSQPTPASPIREILSITPTRRSIPARGSGLYGLPGRSASIEQDEHKEQSKEKRAGDCRPIKQNYQRQIEHIDLNNSRSSVQIYDSIGVHRNSPVSIAGDHYATNECIYYESECTDHKTRSFHEFHPSKETIY